MTSNTAAIPPAQSPTDVAEIEAIARDYAEGWYDADSARMDRALHPDLVKRMLDDGDESGTGVLRSVTRDRMVELAAEGGGGMEHPNVEVVVYDVTSPIASARALSPEYVDYLHLVKTPAGWKIANVLFRVRA